jgi:hypothetical protein
MLYLDDEVTTSAAAGKKKRINTKFYKSVSEKLETMTDIERKEDLKQKLASVKQLKYYADPNDMLDLKTTFAEEWEKALVNEKPRKRKSHTVSEDGILSLGNGFTAPDSYLVKIYEDLPMEMAFKVTEIPHAMLSNMMSHYGNSSYVKIFGEKSERISMSAYDTATLQGYHGKPNNSQSHRIALSYLNEEVFDVVVESLRVEEANMARSVQYLKKLKDVVENNALIKKGADIQKKDHSRYQGQPIDVVQGICTNDCESIPFFTNCYNIKPWWSFEYRTRYLMDFWSAFPNNATESENLRGADTELRAVTENRGSTLDTTYLSYEGSVTQSTLQTFLKEALQRVLGREIEETEVVFGTGILKTGKSAGHQELHVDDISLIKTDEFEKANSGEYLNMSPDDWLNCGYVVDMPLSREGSWLRIAVPEPGFKNFRMELVHIPFGSLLVRSMCLLHSGHYGSPGNTRFHATVQVDRTTHFPDTNQLGYIRCIQDVKTFVNWTVKWNPLIKEEFREANNVHSLRTDQIGQLKRDARTDPMAQLKRDGARIWKRIVQHKNDQLESIALFLNPSPPK